MDIIKIREILVDMLSDIAPDFYGPYVTTDRKVTKQLITQGEMPYLSFFWSGLQGPKAY